MANNINFGPKVTDYQNTVNDQFAGVNLCTDNTVAVSTLASCLNISESQNSQEPHNLELRKIEQLNETDSGESSENELQTAVVLNQNRPVSRFSRCRSADSLHAMHNPQFMQLAIIVDKKFKTLYQIIDQQNDKISDLTKKVEKNDEIEFREQCKTRQTQEKLNERLSDLERASRRCGNHG